jgi:MFS transporter, NNP family, nitrate/nitrite transporter
MGPGRKSVSVLTMNTLSFTVCFACWMMNGVLITFLVDHGIFDWSASQIGWLMGIPVLTGSLTRLPVGILTDKYGGRFIFAGLMLISAMAMLYASYAQTYFDFIISGLGFGLTGASFAVGIAFTSVWFKKERQGTALGIFGGGNIGAALTSMAAPALLLHLTHNGTLIENWRTLPRIYAASLVIMTLLFYFFTYPKKVEHTLEKSMIERLATLKNTRVWRFGLYYFFVFGGFVALAQWLIPYFVSVYEMTIVTAGIMATTFSLPSAVIRALGGWLSDKCGARRIMYRVFSICLGCSLLLTIPNINIWIFTILVLTMSLMMGLGMAAVYKHIPDYFPNEVGVVGGIVGVIGGLGGFICPLIFGYLLEITGVWTTCWMFFSILITISLFLMHRAIQHMMKEKVPDLMCTMERMNVH